MNTLASYIVNHGMSVIQDLNQGVQPWYFLLLVPLNQSHGWIFADSYIQFYHFLTIYIYIDVYIYIYPFIVPVFFFKIHYDPLVIDQFRSNSRSFSIKAARHPAHPRLLTPCGRRSVRCHGSCASTSHGVGGTGSSGCDLALSVDDSLGDKKLPNYPLVI